MRRAAAVVVVVVVAAVACGPATSSKPPPTAPTTPAHAGRAGSGSAEPTPEESEAASQERLAAIEKAMNDLDAVARQCWAAAAVERFDIEGNLEARIGIEAGHATVEIVTDTTRNKKLAACMVGVLERYPWAPPLRGQTIQLPFRFRAPDGQSVIDRALVPWVGQGKISVAVLLDEHNTGNDAASMLEVAIAAGGSTGWRQSERAELWFFLGDGEATTIPPVKADSPARTPVHAGDALFVPAKTMRDIGASTADLHAVLVYVAGGPEGTGRAGALEAREVTKGTFKATFLPASGASPHGPVAILAEPSTIHASDLAASVLTLPSGASVAEHTHDKETEMLYVLEGGGTLTVGGVALPVTATSVVQIPKGVRHAVQVSAAGTFKALQIYTPAGPEQRFKK